MKKIVFVIIVSFLAACASVKLMTPADSDVDRMKTKYPGLSLDELNSGKTLYEQHCNACHGLKNPSSRSETQWKEVVPRMSKKVNKEKMILGEKEQDKIIRYLVTMGSAPVVK
jgi:hypothetical protein